VFCNTRYCGPLLHKFHHQHIFPVPENNCHQLSGKQNIFLTFHHLLLIRCDWEIIRQFCGITLKKVKAEAILCVLCAPVSIFWTLLVQNLWRPSPTAIISKRTVHKICGNSLESSEIVKCHLSHIAWSTLWTRLFIQTADHFALHREHLSYCSPFFEHSTPLTYSSFIHYISAINHTQFMTDLGSTHDFSMKKADNWANYAAGGVINCRTQLTL
jgi:hypothetical protein